MQIIIIQACQAVNPPEVTQSSHSTSSASDAGRWNPDDHQSVILDRAHTLLLMSSVVGGYAKRGAFTGAMAMADGKTTIDEMVMEAKIDMKKNEEKGYNQTPESRSTLQKSLILPPADFKPDYLQSRGYQSKRKLLEKLGVL